MTQTKRLFGKSVSDGKAGKKLDPPKTGVKGFFSHNKFIIMAFVFPFIIMSIGFASQNVAPFGILKTMVDSVAYHIGQWFPQLGIDVKPNVANPWGDRQILVIDLWHQYYPFLVELHEKLQSGGSLLYSWAMGMGSNFVAAMSYYLLSPLNFLSVIIPDSWLVEYLALATAIKISCMGMFTAIAFRAITKRNDLSLVVFSMLYAFCAFNMGYYWCVIWLDSVAMLPLCVAGTIALLRDGKFKLFTISLALAIIFNYYIGLFICVGVLFTCIGYEASRWGGIRKALKDFVRTLTFTVISLCMTAPITIPTFLALQNCYKQQIGMPKKLDVNVAGSAVWGADIEDAFIGIGNVFSNLFSFLDPTSRSGIANVSCGLLCLVLAGIFFCAKKIKLGEKIFCGTTLLFLVASFVFRHLDYIWHGFRFPNELPGRFSFLLSFLLIYMAYRAYTLIGESHYLDVVIAALIFVLLVLCYFTREDKNNTAPLIASCIVAGVYILLVLMFNLKIFNIKTLTLLLCLVVCGEMIATSVIGVDTVTTTTMSGYPKEESSMQIVLETMRAMEKDGEDDLYRVETLTTQTLNDGTLNSYNGISMFNSMANGNITKYLERIGIGGWQAGNRYTYYESSPVTNVMLNLKYLISRDGYFYNTDYTETVFSRGSVKLLKNTHYLPMGYVANSELETYGQDVYGNNPFDEQIEWWQKATGIKEPVYTQIPVKDQGHTPYDILQVNKSSEGHYTATPVDTSAQIHTKFNYYPEEGGTILVYFKADHTQDKKIKIMVNDQDKGTRTLSRSHISMAAVVEAGDKVSVYCDLETGKNNSITVYCYQLNEAVFEKGLEILSKGGLKTTSYSDTTLEGTVNADRNGLFFTSIPYEKGWKAYVDGKEVEISPVSDAMVAFHISKGEHTIKLTYVPDGFVLGVAAFCFAVILFALLCFISSKYMKDNKVKAGVCAFLKADVKKRVKPVVVAEAEGEGADFEEGLTYPESTIDEIVAQGTAADLAEAQLNEAECEVPDTEAEASEEKTEE